MWSLEWWGFVLAMGFSCSILGINVAHELGHRPERHNQLLSQALLTTSCTRTSSSSTTKATTETWPPRRTPNRPTQRMASGVLVPSGVCRVVVRLED